MIAAVKEANHKKVVQELLPKKVAVVNLVRDLARRVSSAAKNAREKRVDLTLQEVALVSIPLGDQASIPLGDQANIPLGDQASILLGVQANIPQGDQVNIPLGDLASVPQ
jgi:transcription antitermination factor NusA-like protein